MLTNQNDCQLNNKYYKTAELAGGTRLFPIAAKVYTYERF